MFSFFWFTILKPYVVVLRWNNSLWATTWT